MAAGPISYLEIEAYQRASLNRLTPWIISVVRDMDDAARGVVAKNQPKSASAKSEPEGIPVSDVKGIKALFAGIKARQQAKGNDNG